MDCSTPGLPVHHQLLDLTQTHVHQAGDAIQLSHPLSSPSLPAFNLSQHQGNFMTAVTNTTIYKTGKQQGSAVCYGEPHSSLSGNNREKNVKKIIYIHMIEICIKLNYFAIYSKLTQHQKLNYTSIKIKQ